MKLIGRSAPLQQLLFACLGTLLTGAVASAQDTIVFTNGQTQSVNIVGVEKGQAMIETPSGKLGRSLGTIKEVRKAAPREYAAAVTAYEKGDFGNALKYAQAVSGQFKGLPTPWARQATSMVGDIYAALGQDEKAIAAYEDFQKTYPGGAGGTSDVGNARVLVMQKKYDEAKAKLLPVTEAALKEKTASGVTALAYSQAFYLLAQVQEAQGELVPALENYLRTATLFRQDRAAAAAAQAKADALRKDPSIHVP